MLFVVGPRYFPVWAKSSQFGPNLVPFLHLHAVGTRHSI